MRLHEYQAKEFLREFGIPMREFALVSNPEEARYALAKLQLDSVVIKAQVQASHRAGSGCVKVVQGKEQILQEVKNMLGFRLINHQTGVHGKVVHSVLITGKVSIAHEYTIVISIDNELAKPFILFYKGKEKSEAHSLKMYFSQEEALLFDGIADFMDWKDALLQEGKRCVEQLVKAFFSLDATYLEIDLALTWDTHFELLDAKLIVDDYALYRQPKVRACHDPSQFSTLEQLAKRYHFSYESFDGTIACLANEQALALASKDTVEYFGGAVASVLDIDGCQEEAHIVEAFKILLKDPRVKAIFVNVLGKTVDCYTLAKGMVQALKESYFVGKRIPMIVRMSGVQQDKGRYFLIESNYPIKLIEQMEEAARHAVIAAGIL